MFFFYYSRSRRIAYQTIRPYRQCLCHVALCCGISCCKLLISKLMLRANQCLSSTRLLSRVLSGNCSKNNDRKCFKIDNKHISLILHLWYFICFFCHFPGILIWRGSSCWSSDSWKNFKCKFWYQIDVKSIYDIILEIYTHMYVCQFMDLGSFSVNNTVLSVNVDNAKLTDREYSIS